MIYKVPMTLTVNCVVIAEAATPEGAITLLKTSLNFNSSEFEDCEGLLFEPDLGIEVTEAEQIGEPSFGAVTVAEDQDDGTGEPDEAEELEDQAPETGGEATPPKGTDLK